MVFIMKKSIAMMTYHSNVGHSFNTFCGMQVLLGRVKPIRPMGVSGRCL